jgi:NhaP-type Na+/H+ or K+/H+ antiporter
VIPTLGLAAVLVLVLRPAVAAVATVRTDLSRGERMFTGWMAPRGIVAAATATTFSASLAAHGVGGAAKILPVTFLVIVASAVGRGAQLEGVTAVLLLTAEDDFNALASTLLEAGGETKVYQLGPPARSHGVQATLSGRCPGVGPA